MRNRINIKTTTASWTEFILKTMFEIVFKQMTQARVQSYNEVDSFMIFTIKITIGGLPDEF